LFVDDLQGFNFSFSLAFFLEGELSFWFITTAFCSMLTFFYLGMCVFERGYLLLFTAFPVLKGVIALLL
jgi:hypothetical protein